VARHRRTDPAQARTANGTPMARKIDKTAQTDPASWGSRGSAPGKIWRSAQVSALC
jgi:hypothetical protein